MSRLNGRIAIVTGGCSGIGRATVELFAAEGAEVYAVDVAKPRQAFEQEAVHFASLDVASAPGWQALTEDVAARHGRIDVLVNNAGIGGSMAALADEELESWHQVLAVNLTGTFLGMRAVIPRMLTQGAGSIINLSSIWGNAAVAFGAAYHASKGAFGSSRSMPRSPTASRASASTRFTPVSWRRLPSCRRRARELRRPYSAAPRWNAWRSRSRSRAAYCFSQVTNRAI